MSKEALELVEIETEIEKDVRAIWVGLLKIREQKLYLADPQYKTWESYCGKRWAYSKRYVNQQLQFQRALESGAVAPADTTERAFRGKSKKPKKVFNAGIRPQSTRNVPIDVSHAEIVWMRFDEWVEELLADLPDLELTRDTIISIISGDHPE